MEQSIRRISHEEVGQVIHQLTEPGTLSKGVKKACLNTFTLYQQQVRGETEAANLEQARRIEQLEQQALKLQEEVGDRVFTSQSVEDVTAHAREEEEKVRFLQFKVQSYEDISTEIATLDHNQVERQLEKGRSIREWIKVFNEVLLHKVALLEVKNKDNVPSRERLQGQVKGDLQCLQQEPLKAEQKIKALAEQLHLPIPNKHPEQAEEMTAHARETAEKLSLLQAKVEGYERVAMDVAILPHDQLETQLEEDRRSLAFIKVWDEVLDHVITLLEVKQKEHLVIQSTPQAQVKSDNDIKQLQELIDLVPKSVPNDELNDFLQNAVKATVRLQEVFGTVYSGQTEPREIGALFKRVINYHQNSRNVATALVRGQRFSGKTVLEQIEHLPSYIKKLRQQVDE